MTIKSVYQTLEDRDTDLTALEENGPYPCNWSNSWLGDGYYFWDTFIENAHWWGEEIRDYQNGYIICQAECDFNDEDCFDLVGSTDHLLNIHNTFELMKKEGLANNQTTVKRIISHLKDIVKTFHYSAIRAYGIRSKNYHSKFSFTQVFEHNRPGYLDYKPPIQICFFEKGSLNLREFRVVYPEEYSTEYV